MKTRWLDSPLGGLRIHVDSGLLTRIEFAAEVVGDRSADRLLDEVEQQLGEYFAGERQEFELPVALDGTEFQSKVWSYLRTIPFGQTRTYGEVAADLGYAPGISRAVGAANGANPIPIVVPCHRVIGADGSLTGYSGGLERKQFLLALEQDSLF
ncbi:MAG TPA: methylated-DNA--[protein]-cysteine S-methyltransferase [Aeromicrobium sp.]|nr:methylated-DNA--[protein]-cysteine S-methyltransferase [Aeromicrobium sp.]